MPVTRKIKDPNSTLDFPVDWSEWLDDSGDTISAVSWIVPAGITKASEEHTDTVATIWLTGGTAKAIYPVTCRVTTAAGRIEDFTFEILMVEK